ncbi:hypothetical protein ACMAUO_04490 [Gluconacetobacter sp. Hr-1-5]|uniref:hypothetical protein n=1 Tax=Gluconacetobacter sp. Hr-1-5 TaxID=3395370 RepID=UPI003B52A3C9
MSAAGKGGLFVILTLLSIANAQAREFLRYEPSVVSMHGSIQRVPCVASDRKPVSVQCHILRLTISRPVDVGQGVEIDTPVTNQRHFDIVLEQNSIVAGVTGARARAALSELVDKPVRAIGSLTYAPTMGTTTIRFVVRDIERDNR